MATKDSSNTAKVIITVVGCGVVIFLVVVGALTNPKELPIATICTSVFSLLGLIWGVDAFVRGRGGDDGPGPL